jgi:hypothetical protein
VPVPQTLDESCTRMSLVTWRMTACPEHWQELSVGEVPAKDDLIVSPQEYRHTDNACAAHRSRLADPDLTALAAVSDERPYIEIVGST